MNVRQSAAIALLVAVLPLAGVGVMMTNDAMRIRALERRCVENVQAAERYVDIGVRLSVVVADAAGEALVEGAPLLRAIRHHVFGGILDTRANPPTIVGPSRNPRQWYCSEAQESIILHRDTDPVGKLAIGGMGAGKTTAGVMWLYLRWLEALDLGETDQRRQGGVTAPTEKRMLLVLDEMKKLWPHNWFRFSTATNIATLCDGASLRFVSTKRQSAAAGSPLQGFNWSWWLADELQDQLEEFIHAVARLRSGVNGRAKRLGTATAKDDPAWRTFKSERESAGDWKFHQMLGPESPFINAEHWRSMARGMTNHQYRRLVMAEDLPSELRLYFGWDRDSCLRPIPITARKITSIVLGRKTGSASHALLAGHDPGQLKGATVYLDAYQVPGVAHHVWWVRGERMHKRQTTQRSARDIIKDAQSRGLNRRAGDGIVHVRAQPVGQTDENPSEDLYRIFRAEGLDVRAAQYKKDGTGTGVIKKEDRIEMVNWLFESGRLFIECDDMKRPVAPALVGALEMLERDHRGKAEAGPKNEHDVTDAPCALGYALWPFEKASASGLRADIDREVEIG